MKIRIQVEEPLNSVEEKADYSVVCSNGIPNEQYKLAVADELAAQAVAVVLEKVDSIHRWVCHGEA